LTIKINLSPGGYELSFLKNAGGFREAVFSGWRVNPIWIAQTGAPFTVNLSVDQANIGAGPAQRPNQSMDPSLPAGQRTPDYRFDTAAFAMSSVNYFFPRPGVRIVADQRYPILKIDTFANV